MPIQPPDGMDENWNPLWLTPQGWSALSPRNKGLVIAQRMEDERSRKKGYVPRKKRDLVKSAFLGCVSQARKRTDAKITREVAEALWERCRGCCEVTGIPFSLERQDRKFARRPWAPSIDQIEAGKGYGLGNIRVVCIAVNYAMNHWGEEVLFRIARELTKNTAPRGQEVERGS